MLPFLNVLNVGIVAAFAAIEEIPAIIDMRIDRKKAFLTLIDFPTDTPPAFFFLSFPHILNRWCPCIPHAAVCVHLLKNILARYSSLPGIVCEIPPLAISDSPCSPPRPSARSSPPPVPPPLQAVRAAKRYEAVRFDGASRLVGFCVCRIIHFRFSVFTLSLASVDATSAPSSRYLTNLGGPLRRIAHFPCRLCIFPYFVFLFC